MTAVISALRVAIYVRVSSDPKRRWKSVGEQEAECRTEAARRGWDVVAVFCDNDRSASRFARKPRPGFIELQRFIAGGGCDVLLSWEGSRNQRDLGVFVQLRDLLESNGVLWSYDGEVLDMRRARDRKRAAEDATDAEYEADRTSERVRRHVRASAAAGRPHGRRLFGYQRTYDPATGVLTGQEPHPTEAAVVRRIFDACIAGDGVRTIARALNADGVKTGTGARWEDTQVNRVLRNPAYVALRVHQGEIVGPADWPPLVDADLYERVQARLDAVRTFPRRQTRNANLLTGVARCGKCGGKVQRGHDRNARKVYICKVGHCVGRDLRVADAYVVDLLLRRLARPDVAEQLAGTSAPDPAVVDARQQITELRSRLDDAIAEFTAGNLTGATLARIETDVHRQIKDAEATIRRAAIPLHIDLPDGDLEPWWDAMDTPRQREVIAAAVVCVTIKPIGSGRRRYDPAEGIEVEWR
jgi:site-specific DNA recombinase